MCYEQYLAAICIWRLAGKKSLDHKRTLWKQIKDLAGHSGNSLNSVVVALMTNTCNCPKPYPSEKNAEDWMEFKVCIDVVWGL